MAVGVYRERGGLQTLMILYRAMLRTTTQFLIVLETDRPVTISTAHG